MRGKVLGSTNLEEGSRMKKLILSGVVAAALAFTV
jgi:hypothetical protein